jgi:hypothetical protein
MGTVTVSMNFLTRDELYQEERPYLLIYEPPEGFPKTNIRLEKHRDLELEDIRGRENQFCVASDGFEILKIKTSLPRESFDDEQLVKDVYLREAADAVRTMFGAQKVQIFEHLLRKRHETYPISTGEPYKYNQPTSVAHVGKCLEEKGRKDRL